MENGNNRSTTDFLSEITGQSANIENFLTSIFLKCLVRIQIENFSIFKEKVVKLNKENNLEIVELLREDYLFINRILRLVFDEIEKEKIGFYAKLFHKNLLEKRTIDKNYTLEKIRNLRKEHFLILKYFYDKGLNIYIGKSSKEEKEAIYTELEIAYPDYYKIIIRDLMLLGLLAEYDGSLLKNDERGKFYDLRQLKISELGEKIYELFREEIENLEKT